MTRARAAVIVAGYGVAVAASVAAAWTAGGALSGLLAAVAWVAWLATVAADDDPPAVPAAATAAPRTAPVPAPGALPARLPATDPDAPTHRGRPWVPGTDRGDGWVAGQSPGEWVRPLPVRVVKAPGDDPRPPGREAAYVAQREAAGWQWNGTCWVRPTRTTGTTTGDAK